MGTRSRRWILWRGFSGLWTCISSYLCLVGQAPRVLTVMLTHSDCSMLPLVRDIVQDVLMALDLSYDHTAALFCSVLHALMKALGEISKVMSTCLSHKQRFEGQTELLLTSLPYPYRTVPYHHTLLKHLFQLCSKHLRIRILIGSFFYPMAV